jgi:IS30 family transposase
VTHIRGTRLVFWAGIRAGLSVENASAGAGVAARVGASWFGEAGGVMPPATRPPARYRRLSIDEREQIHAGMERSESIQAIGRLLGRAASTIKREVDKNLHHQRYGTPGSRGRNRTQPWNYSPHLAQVRADRQAGARARPAKLAVNQRLREEVQSKLGLKHSPEQIARRLREDFPDEPEMWVSHETIYQSIYVQGRGGLRRDLALCLRTGRAVRKPHRTTDARQARGQARIKGMVSISERPQEVEDRAVPGHWEGDLITGTQNKSAIGTLVERTTGFVMLLHLPHDHGALAVQEAMIGAISRLPDALRGTMTWDQGIEMANHTQITLATDMKIYFCDPASPWQRGTNENTNGLLRQYFPKGTDLSGYHPDYLVFVADELNDRPRRRLTWKTPKEALRKLLSDPKDPNGVALAG